MIRPTATLSGSSSLASSSKIRTAINCAPNAVGGRLGAIYGGIQATTIRDAFLQ
jgi:hypothetical protein